MDGEKQTILKRVWRFLCCIHENTYCWWFLECWPLFEKAPQKPDIRHILQPNYNVSEDAVSTSSTSLLHHQSGNSSLSSSVSSVKDIKADIYHQIEVRRSSSSGSKKLPVIDIRPIEFWSGAKGEGVQSGGLPTSPSPYPRSPRKMSETDALTKIRPHLYTSTSSSSLEETVEEEDLGRIHFSFSYGPDEGVLFVKIIEAVDLPLPVNKDRSDQLKSNPYVRVTLLPDILDAKQTDVKKKTQNPVFGETFSFSVPYPEVIEKILELKVKEFDKLSHHSVIGKVQIPLEDKNLARSTRMWRPLQPCEPTQDELGAVLISLNFLPTAGRLNVDILKAKQLLRTSLIKMADPFVRVSLVVKGKHFKSKKTSVKRNSLEPSFHESFSFRMSITELKETSVIVTVLDFNAGVVKDEFIGRIVIGNENSGSAEGEHWAKMMASQRHAVAQWHCLHSRAHCDQLCSSSRLVL